jgi:putative hydrolase of the HAD superfamily
MVLALTTERPEATPEEIAATFDQPGVTQLALIDHHDAPQGALTLAGDEISYWLCPAARGGGWATRAVGVLTGWALARGVVPVLARVNPGNNASRAVLERLAFRVVGEETTDASCAGPGGTVVVYARWPITTVLFDLGGVVLDSPMAAIAGFENTSGLPPGLINRVVAATGAGGAWARLERGEITRSEFLGRFAAELGGHQVDTGALMEVVEAATPVRLSMLEAVRALRAAGFKVGAITNNWIPFGSSGLVEEFDVFVESVVEGTRKPEPEIYRRCLERLGSTAEETVMLDDLGPNLKAARELGMATLKVGDPARALTALAVLLGPDSPRPRKPAR